MRKIILLAFVLLYSFCLSSCFTVQETEQKIGQGLRLTGQKIGQGLYLCGKTVADGSYNTYKAVGKADQWFKDNCW